MLYSNSLVLEKNPVLTDLHTDAAACLKRPCAMHVHHESWWIMTSNECWLLDTGKLLRVDSVLTPECFDPSPLPSQAFLKIRALSCWKVSCSCVPHGNKLVQYTLIISLVVHFSSAYFPSLWLKERETSSLVQLGRNKKITRPAGSTTPLSIQSWHGLQAG